MGSQSLLFALWILVLLLPTLCVGSEHKKDRTWFPCEIKHIALSGDSILRTTFVEILKLYQPSTPQIVTDPEAYKGHRDFFYTLYPSGGRNLPLIGKTAHKELLESGNAKGTFLVETPCKQVLSLSFYWNPFVTNQTSRWKEIIREDPDTIILNLGYWDLLHFHDTRKFLEDFGGLLAEIRNTVETRLKEGQDVPHVVLLNLGPLEAERCQTEEKRTYMHDEHAKTFNKILEMFIDQFQISEWVSLFDFHQMVLAQPPSGEWNSTRASFFRTVDGIHPIPSILEGVPEWIVKQFELTTDVNGNGNRRRIHLPEGGNNGNTNLNDSPKKPAPSVGQNPILGLVVGAYFFFALLLKDSFFVLGFITKFFLKQTEFHYESLPHT